MQALTARENGIEANHEEWRGGYQQSSQATWDSLFGDDESAVAAAQQNDAEEGRQPESRPAGISIFSNLTPVSITLPRSGNARRGASAAETLQARCGWRGKSFPRRTTLQNRAR